MKSVPIIGPNSKGIALTTDGNRPVVIEYVDNAVGFFHVRDLENSRPYTIFRTSFMPSQQIPSEQTEKAFQRVAAHWAEALHRHPEPYLIDPAPLSCTSYMRLLRKAREAKNTYHWQFPTLDEEKWKLYANDITITETSEGVLMGLKNAKFPPKSEIVGLAVPRKDEILFDWKTEQQLDAFCLCLSNKLFAPCPLFYVQNLTPHLILSLEARYELGFVQHETDKNKWSIV